MKQGCLFIIEMDCQSTVMCDVLAVAEVGVVVASVGGAGDDEDDDGADKRAIGQSDILSAATCCVSDVTSVTMYWYCAHVCTQPRLALRRFSTVWKTADSSCGDGGSLALSTGGERRELFCDRKLVGCCCGCCCCCCIGGGDEGGEIDAPRAHSAKGAGEVLLLVFASVVVSLEAADAVVGAAGGAGAEQQPVVLQMPLQLLVHDGDDGTSPSSSGSMVAVTSIEETTLSTKARCASTALMVVESQCSAPEEDDDGGDDGAGVVWSEPSTTCSMRVDAAINVPARPMPALQWQMNGA
jgi:hypothetical protein